MSDIAPQEPVRVGFLVSGNGGSLKFVHHVLAYLKLPFVVTAVLADRACGALEYARAVGLPCQLLDYTRKDAGALQQALQEASPDVVVTNIHKIIDAETLRLLPGRFINLHYSLLPAFKGLIGMQTIDKARELNVTVVGATCHEVDEQVDNGRCLAQFAVGVDWSRDTLPEVYELVFRGACLALLQGLLQHRHTTSKHTQHVVNLLDRPSIFAPALSFPAEALDEAFWQYLKKH
ncbi:hypothetical protein MTX78_05270 [Hymenobacter tibetensis]|uniref:phosphoribosylglycinamide formyltransferase 1 n=1 Tax=Hymenobacter tibetensis TaxID=497967 RepID=A0ABY4D0F4_9BACT|nr:formyltransferase family protein [Hymenobacter tibetensis]UOG76010.1 hypothetical protein MTX78_05270 [Hymenobacter tibetensis]